MPELHACFLYYFWKMQSILRSEIPYGNDKNTLASDVCFQTEIISCESALKISPQRVNSTPQKVKLLCHFVLRTRHEILLGISAFFLFKCFSYFLDFFLIICAFPRKSSFSNFAENLSQFALKIKHFPIWKFCIKKYTYLVLALKKCKKIMAWSR